MILETKIKIRIKEIGLANYIKDLFLKQEEDILRLKKELEKIKDYNDFSSGSSIVNSFIELIESERKAFFKIYPEYKDKIEKIKLLF